jgi:hypothetical protein
MSFCHPRPRSSSTSSMRHCSGSSSRTAVYRDRWAVLAAWCAALVLSAGAARMAGSDYVNGFSLPGTGSSQAVSLLQSASPAVAGDTEQVVIEAVGPALITDPAVAARVRAMLSRVAKVPGVTRVGSPYGPSGGSQVSPDHRVAFATVTFAGRPPPSPRPRGTSSSRRPGPATAAAGRGCCPATTPRRPSSPQR